MGIKESIVWAFQIDSQLAWFVSQFQDLTYLILAAIVFIENGIVLIPFLPGDSLLFVCGAFAAKGVLNLTWLIVILTVSSVAGGMFNYGVGRWAAKRFADRAIPFVNQKHIEKTRDYFDKYGAITVLVARFFPIVRTFAPFLAGLGLMNFYRFLFFNLIGSVVWVLVFALGGYFFGGIPIIADNMVAVTMGILVISILPVAYKGVFSARTLSKNNETR